MNGGRTHQFRINDLVRNKKTNEDGKVTEAYEENGVLMYLVSVPEDPTSWQLGATEARWSERDLVLSPNKLLKDGAA
jgi:hypothetical protein